MIFDTIPEPLVTLQEVRCLLEKLFLPSDNNKEVIDIFCEWFERLMPECVTPLTPRTLKHLCRCLIRDNLRKNRRFPYEVRHLPLPKFLKDEILLEHWFPAASFENENKELSFFDGANIIRSSFGEHFFNRRVERTLDIMNENYQREIESQSSVNRKRL